MSLTRWTSGRALLACGVGGTAIVIVLLAILDGGTEPSTDEDSTVEASGPERIDPSADCEAPTVRVSTAESLQAALTDAQPGDRIQIDDGVHVGKFVATGAGTETDPITLCGGPAAVLDGGGIKGGYVLHLDGVQHWRVLGFTVQNGQKGVVADAVMHTVIQGLTVQDIGDEAIHLRSASSDNAVIENTIRRTGLRRDKFGEGVYIGSATSNWSKYSDGDADRSDRNLVMGNVISETGSESIDVKEGTTGGRVVDNVLDGTGMTGADSLIDVKGNDWVVEGNVGVHAPGEALQTHRILEGWGTRNVIRGNTFDVDGDGRHIYVHDPEVTENQVACSNRTGSGVALRSNVECVGP
jgi:nitrous oxidase accessory protein NosD